MTAAAVYLRVSTDRCRFCSRKKHKPLPTCPRFEPEQQEENQEPDCARLCTARGWEPVWYRERESGAKQRPEWDRLVEDARRGHVRAVVFWALDRIGRTEVEVGHDVRELSRWNVQLVSVQDAWLDQPPGPFRDLMLNIVAWFSESERRRLIARTKAGQARARAEGKVIGRPQRVTDAAVSAALAYQERHPKVTLATLVKLLRTEGHGEVKRGTLWTAMKARGRVPETGGTP